MGVQESNFTPEELLHVSVWEGYPGGHGQSRWGLWGGPQRGGGDGTTGNRGGGGPEWTEKDGSVWVLLRRGGGAPQAGRSRPTVQARSSLPCGLGARGHWTPLGAWGMQGRLNHLPAGGGRHVSCVP